LTRFLLVQSEFSPNWTVSSVFDSKLQLAITFAYKLHFRRATTQNAQHKKFYLATTTLWLCGRRNAQNSQKSPGRLSFFPLKFWTRKFLQIFTYILLLSCFFLLVVPRREFLSVLGSRL
jgi:hypothetical protein